jgi:uncharacterized protein (TIGR02117 family)
MKRLRANIAGTLIFLLYYFCLTGCALPAAEREMSVNEPAALPVYVVSHGWHTGIAVDRDLVVSHLPALKQDDFSQPGWIEFGWGDAGYYQAKEKTKMLAARAILFPTDSVLHVATVPWDLQRFFPGSEIGRLLVTEDGLQEMLRFIGDSFKRDSDGRLVRTGRGLYGQSFFYRATGNFHALNTCNSWTAKALKKAGFPVKTWLTVTAEDVMDQVRDLQKAYNPPNSGRRKR